jgi:type VI secretion system lysozyme-like protein
VLQYGFPDFITYSLNTDQAQNDLALAIAQVIRDFEPRLVNVSITPMLEGGRLTFRVKADLQIEPTKERVQFQAVLEAESGRLITGEI